MQDTNNQDQKSINKLNDMVNHAEYFDLSKDVGEDIIDELLQYKHNKKEKNKKSCKALINKVYEQYKQKVRKLKKEDNKRPDFLKHYISLSNVNLDNGFFIK